jgi:putative acetyltransferase
MQNFKQIFHVLQARGNDLPSSDEMQKNDSSRMPRLRPATNADGDAVRTLVFEVLREYGLSPDSEGTDADLFKIEQHYRNGWFSVLEVDGQIIGSVGLSPQEKTVMELRKMYLHRDWRARTGTTAAETGA